MQKWYASGTVYAKPYRTMSELSAASKELRKAFPDHGAIRLRTAKRQVGLVYQVLFELDGKSKALQLEATSVLEAYEAAKVVLAERRQARSPLVVCRLLVSYVERRSHAVNSSSTKA